MRIIAFVSFFLIVVLMASCLHDNDDSSSATVEDQPIVEDQLAEGIYLSFNSGFVSEANGNSVTFPVDAIIASTGEARFLFFGSSPLLHTQLAGNVKVDADEFTVSLKSYFDGNAQTSSAMLDGTVVTRDGIWGSYTWDQDFGRIALVYDPAYEEPSELRKLEGIWTFSQATSGGAVFTFTITIDSDGTVFGSSTAGCVYNGMFEIIDFRYNVYHLLVETSLCGELDGDYEGLATLLETRFDRSLMFGTSNQEHSLSGIVFSPLQP